MIDGNGSAVDGENKSKGSGEETSSIMHTVDARRGRGENKRVRREQIGRKETQEGEGREEEAR